ncbi:MAG: DUF4272 domain-containing protein [Ruminococcus sp.]|nr:DUF4272 domain-containing protein [Ruminococcus sp.]
MKDPQTRKQGSMERLKKMGVAVNSFLPQVEDSTQVKLRDADTVCKKAAATLLIIQLACDTANGEYEESMKVIPGILDEYGVRDSLNAKERRLLTGDHTEQDAIDISWTYEVYWSLLWAMGMIEDRELTEVSGICDCEKAIKLLTMEGGYEGFRSRCRMRDVEEVLDMVDLFYRMDWAAVEHRLRPETPIGSMEPQVVNERRRGLEWLVSDKEDWNDIPLDT